MESDLVFTSLDDNTPVMRRRLLQLVELTAHYHYTPLLKTRPPLIRNPFLDKLLASLVLLQVTSLFEKAIQEQMQSCDWQLPKGVKWDLKNYIDFMVKRNMIVDACSLHNIRKKRNGIAHHLDFVDWSDLYDAMNMAEKQMQEWNIVGERPKYEFFAEKSAVRGSHKPGYLHEQDYEFGIKLNNRKIFSYRWTEAILDE